MGGGAAAQLRSDQPCRWRRLLFTDFPRRQSKGCNATGLSPSHQRSTGGARPGRARKLQQRAAASPSQRNRSRGCRRQPRAGAGRRRWPANFELDDDPMRGWHISALEAHSRTNGGRAGRHGGIVALCTGSSSS